ncbi:arylsulfatase J-like isoform X3 [Littorina saxatilis]
MSGYYPYHLGMQHDSLRATQKAHLPGNVTTLPQHLKTLGYKTHMAGKWHLGFCNWEYTPTYRGFDSFVGFYNAIQDYYTHIGHRNGYDFRHNKDVYWKANGTYSAYIFTQFIEQVIADHDPSEPLFVYLPYQSVHGPLQVPQHYIDKYCSHIHNATRRTHCGLVAALDEGVGNITRALQKKGLYNDTILLFTTDNGGPVHESSNNWPLRGSKATLWEGGTRGTAFLHGPKFFKNSGKSYDGMIHAVDWMPTLVEAAGGPELTGLDGVSQWKSILQAKVPSARTEFVYNFDEMKKNAAIRMGKYKLLEGKPGHPDGWYPPPTMDVSSVQHNYQEGASGKPTVNLRIHEESSYTSLTTDEITLGSAQRLADLFESVVMNSSYENTLLFSASRRSSQSDVIVRMTSEEKDKKEYQLYDLEADPYEHHDVQDKYPDVLKKMVARLEEYRKSLVPANFPPHDPASFPTNFDGTWSPGWC